MISSVTLSGRLGQKLSDSIRFVEVDSLTPGPTGVFSTIQIPVAVHRCLSASFLTAKEGSLVIVKGRLDVEEEVGLLVKAEYEEVFTLPDTLVKVTEKGE